VKNGARTASSQIPIFPAKEAEANFDELDMLVSS
jgi:hypothetical protein